MSDTKPCYLVLGIEADLVKRAICELDELPLILTVHDELVAEVDEGDAGRIGDLIVAAMTRSLSEIEAVIPLEAEKHIARRWSDCK